MKKEKQAMSFVGKFLLPVLLVLVALSLVTILQVNMYSPIKTGGFPLPVPFAVLFDFTSIKGNMQVLGHVLGNILAYVVILAAIVLFILSLVKIKHDNGLRCKSALAACFLLVPAILGMLAGVIDFIGHGFVQLYHTRNSFELIALIVIYFLDAIYIIFALVYSVNAIKLGIKVSQGELPLEDEEAGKQEPKEKSAEEQLRDQEAEAEKRAALLKDIRQIVREELDRLDRVAIVKEQVVVKEEVVEKQPEPEQPKEEPQPEPVAEEEPVEEEEMVEEAAEEEGGENLVGKTIIGPRIPFAEKIVKADKEIQEKYNELKNEILAYGASSRISIAGDTFRLHRKAYVKITLVGKTLKVYFALNPKDYEDSPIPVVDASDKSAYAEVPALLKVKSNLSVKRAKELAAAAFAVDGIEKEQDAQNHNYVKDIRAQLKAQKAPK